MGSTVTYSGVTLYPKGGNRSSKCLPVQTAWEATRLFSVFSVFFFFLALCFLSGSPIELVIWGHWGGPLSEAGDKGPTGFSVGSKLPRFHGFSNIIKWRGHVRAEEPGLLVWPCREGCCVVLFVVVCVCVSPMC